MKCMIFTGSFVDSLENEINAFTDNPKIKVINVLQSEAYSPKSEWSLTITIFYNEV